MFQIYKLLIRRTRHGDGIVPFDAVCVEFYLLVLFILSLQYLFAMLGLCVSLSTPLVWCSCFFISLFLDSMFQFCLFLRCGVFGIQAVFPCLSLAALEPFVCFLGVCDSVMHFSAQMLSIVDALLQFIYVKRNDSSPNSSGMRITRTTHATMAPTPHFKDFFEYSLAFCVASLPDLLITSRVWGENEKEDMRLSGGKNYL